MKTPPTANIKLRETEGQREVYDIVRDRYVALTPEEWVRQHCIHYLHYHLGYPLELMQVEGLPDRARPPLVARFWARKEAFLKCLGIGLSLEPRNLSTIPSIHVPMQDGSRFALRDYRLEGHALAACLPDGIPFPELESIAMEALVASLERDRAKQEQAKQA